MYRSFAVTQTSLLPRARGAPEQRPPRRMAADPTPVPMDSYRGTDLVLAGLPSGRGWAQDAVHAAGLIDRQGTAVSSVPLRPCMGQLRPPRSRAPPRTQSLRAPRVLGNDESSPPHHTTQRVAERGSRGTIREVPTKTLTRHPLHSASWKRVRSTNRCRTQGSARDVQEKRRKRS